MTRHNDSDDSSPPFKVTERTPVTMPVVLLIVLAGAVISSTLAWADLRATDKTHSESISSQEVRIRRLEEGQADIAVIRNNVDWIRRSIESRDRNFGAKNDLTARAP